MSLIHIDNVKAGMVLTDDVRDISSRLLLSKGTEIVSKHLRVFKIWGITEVPVDENAAAESGAEDKIDPERLKRTAQFTAMLFKHNDLKHPAMKELFRHAVLYRARRKSDTEGEPLNSPVPGKIPKDRISPDGKVSMDTIDLRSIKLPEIPSIISELNEVISTPSASASDIAAIVNKSPSLAVLLLRIVNSAFYGFPTKIDNISRAVAMIGSKEISGLAIGISAMTMFRDIPSQIIDMQSFIRHSLACGIISRILAAHKNIQQTEQMFVSGLLHDIGRLVVYKYFPKEAKSLLEDARLEEKALCRIEKSKLGIRHTEIAKQLLNQWKLPFSLESIIVYHHRPSSADHSLKATIVHLADIIVNSLGLGSSGERLVPPFDETAWNQLQMSPTIFRQVVRQAVHQLASLENFLTLEG